MPKKLHTVPAATAKTTQQSQWILTLNLRKLLAVIVVITIIAIGIGLYLVLRGRGNNTSNNTILSGAREVGSWMDTIRPLTSCVVEGTDACEQPVFIRTTAERGLDSPRLRNDVTALVGGFQVRAQNNVSDLNSQWKLKKLANGNFQIISQANNEALRVILDPGQKYPISCDPARTYDLAKKGADGICAEFTILSSKSDFDGRSNYAIGIPDSYSIPAIYRNNAQQFSQSGIIASLVFTNFFDPNAPMANTELEFKNNTFVWCWRFEKV
jgi:hypothetical protein